MGLVNLVNNDDNIRIIINKIVENILPEKIILFGSRATGLYGENSDYDLCILKNNIAKKREMQRKIYLLLSGTGIAADIIVETTEKFNELKNNKFLIYSQIAKEGKVLYEQ